MSTEQGPESGTSGKANPAVFASATKMVLYSTDKEGNEKDKLLVAVNPESYSRGFSQRYSQKVHLGNGRGHTTKIVNFLEKVSFDLWFDGTGVIPDSGDVADNLKWLEDNLVKFDKELHAAPYVKVVWGTLNLKGQVSSLDIDYQYFDPSGKPLRAKAKLSIEGIVEPKELATKSQSPDLTRQHIVQAGETLPLLCQKMYENPSYYLQVAEANNLPHFTNLEPGQKIYFPPLV